MAGRKIKMVKASSILEVVVSMVIILIVFGIALTIFSNVARWSLPYRKIKAELLLRDLKSTMCNPLSSGDQLKQVDGIRFIRTVTPYEADMNLSVLTLSAVDENNQQIAEFQEIIPATQ